MHKNHFLSLLSLVFVLSSVFSQVPEQTLFDFGGTLDSATGFDLKVNSSGSVTSAAFSETLSTSIWTAAEFSDGLTLLGKGSVTVIFSPDSSGSIAVKYNLGLKELRFNGLILPQTGEQSSFAFTLGRINVRDATGWVLSQTLDGVSFNVGFPGLSVNVFSGFTGLLFSSQVGVAMTLADVGTIVKSSSDPLTLAPPRLISGINLVIPEFLLRQDFSLVLLYQYDFRGYGKEAWPVYSVGGTLTSLKNEGDSVADAQIGGRLSSGYLGAALSGPIILPFYYDAVAFLSYGSTLSFISESSSYVQSELIGWFGKIGLNALFPEVLFSRLEINAIFSSGDVDYTSFFEGNTSGQATMFIPINQPPISLIYGAQLGNLAATGITYSLLPFSSGDTGILRNLQAMLKASAFWRLTQGAIFDSGIDEGSTSPYLGTEVNLILNFRPLSDLGVSLTNGVFLPQGSAYDLSQKSSKYVARLTLSFSL